VFPLCFIMGAGSGWGAFHWQLLVHWTRI
jgi:hypothetical protein